LAARVQGICFLKKNWYPFQCMYRTVRCNNVLLITTSTEV